LGILEWWITSAERMVNRVQAREKLDSEQQTETTRQTGYSTGRRADERKDDHVRAGQTLKKQPSKEPD
jgi:hypothetical protein